MEDFLVIGAVMMAVPLSLIPLYLWRCRVDSRLPHQHEDQPHDVHGEKLVRPSGSTRRMRRRTPGSAAANMEDTFDEAAREVNEPVNVSKKEKKRQEMEGETQRQLVKAAEDARGTRKTKQELYDEKRRIRDEEREARERMLEEEAKARKAKEEEAAALEFEKWKGDFSVDTEGTIENEVQEESQSLLFEFMEYIKKHKSVPLEEIAAEFKLRTQDCINRIGSLENMGRLSGVMDDRGKYIYISLEEMKAVADFIRREGRVSISHLASKSNQFIDLKPKAELVEDISGVEEMTFA